MFIYTAQALRYLGQANITAERMEHLKRMPPTRQRLLLIKDIPLTPAWIHLFLREQALGVLCPDRPWTNYCLSL